MAMTNDDVKSALKINPGDSGLPEMAYKSSPKIITLKKKT